MQNVVVVDYGMANLRSVQKALEKVGCAADITGDPGRIAAAGKVVLLSGLAFNSLKVSSPRGAFRSWNRARGARRPT